MANVNIDVQLKVIGNGLAAVSKSTEELVKLQKEATSVGSSFKKIGETAAGVFAGDLFTKGFEAAGRALSSFVDVIGDSITAASAQEDAVNRLNVALASSGNFSQQASADLQEFANQLQATTKFEDDAILNTSALIATITGLSGQALKDATLATVNLSAALGKDLDTSATLVAKSLEGNVGALAKFGVEVKKGATESETLSNVLGSLNKQFGGAAEGQVKTFSGAMASLKNTFGDLLEEIGNVIIKNPVLIDTITAVKEQFLGLGTAVSSNSGDLKTFLANVIVVSTTIATATAVIFDAITRVVLGTIATIKGAVADIGAIFTGVLEAVSGRFDSAFKTITGTVQESGAAIEKAFGENVFSNLSVQLAQVQQASESAFQGMARDAAFVGPVIDKATLASRQQKEALVELTAAQLEQAAQGKALQASANESAAAQFTFELEQQQLLLDQKLITQQGFYDEQERLRNEQFAKEDAQLKLAVQAEELTESEADKIKLVRVKKLDADIAKIDAARAKAKEAQAKRDVEVVGETFGNLSSLTQTGNKTLFEIGKAAAIASATISASLAFLKALEAGPILGPILAASIAIKTGVEISKIASTKLATGITEVPGGFSNDSFPALLTSGERVVSANQNQDLKEFLSDNNNNQGVLEAILAKLDNMANNTVVNIGGREIVNVLNDEIASGMVLRTA